MKRVSRRSVLKGMAGMSLVAAAVPLVSTLGCRRPRETQITLNVVLHGLYVLNIADSCIEMYTPEVLEHKYRAGSWDRKLVFDLGPKKKYRLTGVDPIKDPPDFRKEFSVYFFQTSKGFTVHPELSYCAIQLPFPDQIHFLRGVNGCSEMTCDGSGNGGNPVESSPYDGNPIQITKFSLCQVLVYPVRDYRHLELIGSCWKPYVDEKTGTANLHFWAEPEKRLTPEHAQMAYSHLSELLSPLQLELATDKTAPLDPDTGVRGLSSEEEQGWSEWQGGGEGSYPTNCNTVITTRQPIG